MLSVIKLDSNINNLLRKEINKVVGVIMSSTVGNSIDNLRKIKSSSAAAAAASSSELWCCCCNCSKSNRNKTPGFLACLGICLLVFSYTLLGALAFMALEGGFKTESSMSAEIIPLPNSSKKPTSHDGVSSETIDSGDLRAYTVERLWSITEDLNVLYKDNWTRLAEQEILEFQDKMAKSFTNDQSSTLSAIYPHSQYTSRFRINSHPRWTFGSSLLYSLTLITTIGYGSIAPRTVWGKIITVIYTLAGIPLMLVYLSTVGDVFARTFRRLYRKLFHRHNNCMKKNKSCGDDGGGCNSKSEKYFIPKTGLMEKTYYHYDNHIDGNKFSPSAGQFYSSKDSSCDELGIKTTGGGTIILDHDPIDPNIYSPPSVNPFHQDINEKRMAHPCSQISFIPASSSGLNYENDNDAICVIRIPISLCLLIIILYIICGALLFKNLEGWSLLESSYFCFTSLGTIGFGDLIPTGRNSTTKLYEEFSFCICCLYILIGMGLIAMCFNLMQDEVVRVVSVFGKTCTTTKTSTGPYGVTGMKSDIIEDENIDINNLGDNNCRQRRDNDPIEDGIAMTVVSAAAAAS